MEKNRSLSSSEGKISLAKMMSEIEKTDSKCTSAIVVIRKSTRQ